MPRLRLPFAVLIAALALLFAGCGDSDETTSSTTSTTASEAPSGAGAEAGGQPSVAGGGDIGTAEKAGAVIPEPEAGGEKIDLYFTSGEQFETVPREQPKSGAGIEPALEAATDELVRGPTKAERKARVEVQTQIPDDTRVEKVTVAEDGTADVELSPEFLRGVPAAPAQRNRSQQAEVDARVGQVMLTLNQFDEVKRTKVSAGGIAATPPADPQQYEKPKNEPKLPKSGGGDSEERKGGGSSSVRRIQSQLAKLRYLPKSAVDGVDGYRTQQAIIAFQSWEKLDRDGVVGPMTKAALKTAKPPRPKLNGPSRRVEVYRDKGVTLLVKNDKTKRAIHSSSGGPGTETPRGQFEVFRKELNSWSVPFQTWLPYASYFFQGIAFHEYPDVPTYPASHGCVRVPAPEAPGVYKFAAMGTTVIVY